MIKNKDELFCLIDLLEIGLRNKAIIKDAIEDVYLSIEKGLSKKHQYTILHDGCDWIISIKGNEHTIWKTLREWLKQQ